MGLQWFAAEDEGRTEEPTEQKIRKSREEGKVAKSQELTSSLVLLFGIITLGALGSYMFHNMLEMLFYYFTVSAEVDTGSLNQLGSVFISYILKLCLPVALVAFLAAFLGNVLQVGFLFTTKPITPDMNKIVPKFGKFFKRAFASSESAFNLFKSIGKVAIVFVLAYLNIRMELPKITAFSTAPFRVAFSTIATVAFRIMLETALLLLALSIPDYIFQRRKHKETLKMSKQEVKEERKMHEGDPLIKSRLRERMRDILARNMIQRVPEADVVITNPTHFAVAMEWKRQVMTAPRVVAKGQDHLARRIKEIARENDITIIENKPLARALYSEVEIGDEIPEKYYEVMALVLTEVYRMTGRTAEAVS
ncbi:MAG: flagellar biosynthesis protein FlhB [Spirochaetales bacterium]|nr:flagellar biosynthesis protein FlhB [Spirochaetales bacterium]